MFFKAILAVALAGVALAQEFSINTPPSIQQCQVASLSWVGGTGPFTLDTIPAGQPTAPAISDIATGVSGSPYAWNVNVASGTAITIRIRDSLGNIAYSSPLTVQTGVSSSCLTGGGASSSGSVSASGSATSAASSASASSGPTSARPSSGSATAAPPPSSARPSSSTTPVNPSSSSSAAASASSTGAAGKLVLEGSVIMGAFGAILALL